MEKAQALVAYVETPDPALPEACSFTAIDVFPTFVGG